MDDAPRSKLRQGDPAIIPLEDWNRVRAEMLRLLALGAVPPLVWSWQGGRRTLVDTTPPGLWAQLSGSTSPYTGTQKVRDPATLAWVDGPLSLTNIIEVNGGAGLGGTVQRVEPGAPGEWLFQSVKLGVSVPTSGQYPCTLSSFPSSNLTLTWIYRNFSGTNTTRTITLIYSAGPPRTWTSAYIPIVNYPGAFGNDDHKWGLACSGGLTTLVHERVGLSGGTPLAIVRYDTYTSISESPFALVTDVSVFTVSTGTWPSPNPDLTLSLVS